VFLAEDPRLDRRVALKRPSDEWLSAPDASVRLHREARAAARLTHPHIAGIYDVLDHDGRPYIVMEYVPGESLASRIGRGPLPILQVVEIGAQLADALATAHEHGVVHRDLKPGNVMLMPDGRAKILDFGLAKTRALHAQDRGEPDSLVGAGGFAGTPGYSAPEQYAGGPVDGRSDLFGLGVLLYEMVTGAAAFSGPDTMATVLATINEHLPPLAERRPETPPELDAIVGRLLEKDPRRRPASAATVTADLRRVGRALTERPTTSDAETVTVARAGTRSRRRLLLLTATVVVAAAAALTWWQEIRRSGPAETATPAHTPVVTVLPFRDLTGDPDNGTLAAGLADMFANHMASAAGVLYVPLRATLAGITIDAQAPHDDEAIGAGARSAGVDFALDGSLHASGGRLRLELHLVPALGPRPVWDRSVEGTADEILRAEPNLVAEITAALGGRRAQDVPVTASVDAFRFFSQGQALLDRADLPDHVDRAILLFERAVELDDRFALAHAGLGQAYWRKYLDTRDAKFAKVADDHASAALTLDPDLPLAHMAKATYYNGTGRPDLALVELDHAEKGNPSDEVYRLRGQILFELNRRGEASASFDRAIEAGPGFFQNYLTKGIAALRSGRAEDARVALVEADRLQPDSPQTLEMLGLAYQALGDLDGARDSLERSIAIAPTARACSNLGTLYYEMGQFDLAAERFRQAADLQPNNAQIARNMGDAYARLGRDAEARAAWERALGLAEAAIAVNPRDTVHLGLRAVCEAKLGRFDAARTHLDEALAVNDADNTVLYRAAAVHALAGDTDEAFGYLEKALEAGYSRALARTDEDLASLRGSGRFEELTAAR